MKMTYTYKEAGEANFHTIMKNGDWFANIQLNGEIHHAKQKDIIGQMIGALDESV